MAEKNKALAGPWIVRTQWSESNILMLPLKEVKGDQEHWNLSNPR